MKGVILCLYFIHIFGLSLCDGTVDTFEFGTDVGKVSFTTSGKIGPTEKNIRIPIVTPYCSDLTYVRVDVDNRIGPPHVKMDFDVHTVIIKYRRLQHSISSYVVTAKTVRSRVCRDK